MDNTYEDYLSAYTKQLEAIEKTLIKVPIEFRNDNNFK